jgi:hypothetical protein
MKVNKRMHFRWMKLPSCTIIPHLLFLVVWGLSGAGCAPAPRPIQNGETANVYYACRTPDGALAATNIRDVAEDPKQPKMSVFIPQSSYDPLALVAGKQDECQTCPRGPEKFSGFIAELHRLLAAELNGWENGRQKVIQLTAEALENLPPNARYSRLAKVRRRPKQTRMQAERYTLIAGKEPEVGDRFVSDFSLKGEITGISGDQVDIQLTGVDGSEVVTPLGKGILHEDGDYYALAIQVAEGQLIRTGDVIGRIVDVDDNMFVIDYGYSLGGMDLTCHVRVEAIEPW